LTVLDRALKKFEIIENQRQAIKDQLFKLGAIKCLIRQDDDQWCINQVLEHLILTETLGYNYINKKRTNIKALPKANIVSSLRRRLLSVILSLPFKYKAPKNVMPKLRSEGLEKLFLDWDYQRNLMKDLIVDLDEDINKELFRHPKAGKMNLIDMLEFYESHIAHHLIQINRIQKSLDY
jgi:hypothetical protein